MTEKYKINYYLLLMWLWAQTHGYSPGLLVKDMGYGCIALYGMGEIGAILYHQLKEAAVPVAYVLDRNPGVLCDCPVVSPDGPIPHADLIIVTVQYDYNEIREFLRSKTEIPIISIQELICRLTHFAL